jgi:hypothetical protein
VAGTTQNVQNLSQPYWIGTKAFSFVTRSTCLGKICDHGALSLRQVEPLGEPALLERLFHQSRNRGDAGRADHEIDVRGSRVDLVGADLRHASAHADHGAWPRLLDVDDLAEQREGLVLRLLPDAARVQEDDLRFEHGPRAREPDGLHV